jgi:ABC-type multidrug transport system fused ATPase/permease subunit
MNKKQRIILFIIYVVILSIITLNMFFYSSLKMEIRIILFSSLLMLSFSSLFIEHFFPKPTDILANTFSILLVLGPAYDAFQDQIVFYWILFGICCLAGMLAFISLLLINKEKSQNSKINIFARLSRDISTVIGNCRVLYFGLFLLTMLSYIDTDRNIFLTLFLYSAVILLIQPQKQIPIFLTSARKNNHDVGEVFAVLSENVYLVKIFNDKKLKEFDVVYLNSISQEDCIEIGLVLKIYYLNSVLWARIISIKKQKKEENQSIKIQERNVCFASELNANDLVVGFVGTVIDKSNIDCIRFGYYSKEKIEEGQLLEIDIDEKKVVYQVIQGITEIEELESKDETGLLVGEAVQIGIWDQIEQKFEKYGWTPNINSIVKKLTTIDGIEENREDYLLGQIPNTNIPVYVNLEESIGSHLAVLGVTGSGKSVLARQLVRKLISSGIKVIIVDFTGEYKNKLSGMNILPIINHGDEDAVFKAIDDRINELAEFRNNRKQTVIDQAETIIQEKFLTGLESFLHSESCLALLELPDVSNTTGILEYTRWFFKMLFQIAKVNSNFGKKVCIVIEEAHTVVPEWNFIGESQKEAAALVNAICQIALQGRKYNIGLMVIAQRTANVSKTVLTQCNSIIAFQQFDERGEEFLSSYFNKYLINSLSTLKQRHAIAYGKGFKSTIPLIFRVPDISE